VADFRRRQYWKFTGSKVENFYYIESMEVFLKETVCAVEGRYCSVILLIDIVFKGKYCGDLEEAMVWNIGRHIMMVF